LCFTHESMGGVGIDCTHTNMGAGNEFLFLEN